MDTQNTQSESSTPENSDAYSRSHLSTGSAWDSWGRKDLEKEIRNRMLHFYGKTDGTYVFRAKETS